MKIIDKIRRYFKERKEINSQIEDDDFQRLLKDYLEKMVDIKVQEMNLSGMILKKVKMRNEEG